jgi:hypothetical protein
MTDTSHTLLIDKLYNGAVSQVNGGYICGSLAGFIDGDAEVRINSSFPVETPLQVINTTSRGVEIYLNDRLLGSAHPSSLELDIPPPPDFETARRASEDFIFLHSLDTRGCYVCSPLRSPEDGLRLFIGALDNIEHLPVGQNLVAAVWRPAPNQEDSHGNIKDIYTWSVMDCPGVYALKLSQPNSGIFVLGSCTGSIKRPLRADRNYIVSSWRIAPIDGRKLYMGVAIHSLDGVLMACAKQICFDIGGSLPETD